MPDSPRILMVTGEASGEQAALPVLEALRRQWPDCRVKAVGGERLREAGAEILFDKEELSVMGFGEVLGRLPLLLRRRRELRELLRSGEIDLFLPVDAPGFNLPLCRFARQAAVPALYYIAPQVWAWGRRRVKAMARDLSALAVILPFEEKWFAERGIRARYVGHPLAASYEGKPRPAGEPPQLGILPGSRRQELKRMLPLMLDAARRLARRRPELQFLLLESPSLEGADYDPYLHGLDLPLRRARGEAPEQLPGLDAAWVTSGTATLETALAGVPMVVAYRTGAFNYAIARNLVKVPHIALANLVAGRRLVPERVQGEAHAEALAGAMDELLGSEQALREQREGFAAIASSLGSDDPGEGVAALAREILEGP